MQGRAYAWLERNGAVFDLSFSFLLTALIGLAVTRICLSLIHIFGIVVDPTTAGMADSTRAMGYDEPRGGDGR